MNHLSIRFRSAGRVSWSDQVLAWERQLLCLWHCWRSLPHPPCSSLRSQTKIVGLISFSRHMKWYLNGSSITYHGVIVDDGVSWSRYEPSGLTWVNKGASTRRRTVYSHTNQGLPLVVSPRCRVGATICVIVNIYEEARLSLVWIPCRYHPGVWCALVLSRVWHGIQIDGGCLCHLRGDT